VKPSILKRTAVLLLYTIAFQPGIAQGITDAISARYLGLGAYSTHNVDVYATRTNPASLAQLQRSSVAVYAERRFMLEDMNLYTASAGVVTGSGNFAVHASYFGFELSNQSQLSLSYGRKITGKLDLGASFYYQQLKQASIYGSASAITGSIGLLLHLSDKVHAGVSAYNPIGASFDKEGEEKIPAQYNFGIGYDASEKLYVSLELVKQEGRNIAVNAGLQYKFIKQFFIRTGLSTLNANYYAGLGFNLKDFRFDIATSYHPQLGFSPGLLLLYEFGRKMNKEDN
jgi:hypothetical protein